MAVTSSAKECTHRGEQIGTKTCETCGKVIAIHQCNLLNAPCVWNWTNRTKYREGTTACIGCRQRTLADSMKPWGAVDS